MRVVLVCLSSLVLVALCSAAEETNTATIKIMTFNILHGATTNGDFDLDRIAKVILDENPDVVTLQEVDFKTKRAKGYDLAPNWVGAQK